jgi:leucyl-tRNA synthetase
VVIYLPLSWGNELAGAGVWYGRVGPEHVEGVVGETVVKGRVVRVLLRGGMLRGGVNLARGVEEQEKEERGEGEGGLRLEPRARSG